METPNLKQRLLEADEIISQLLYSNSPWDEAKDYADKYLKPKDPLFEKWKDYVTWYRADEYFTLDTKEAFIKLKEIFKEELNGTKGLNEAIMEGENSALLPKTVGLQRLRQIKQRLDNEHT